ncbi:MULTISPECIES: penicillin acylase family protein [Pontibacillus]|uniref:Penicillin acylase family protein n=1 Tax=Pontibacillus chungwhensis TaxID=265426 RepID=A0ABY8V1A6_9BACI|nr:MULTISPECIES: penicillin acylase family protein [Pontibacillus]MCD5322436.1 penicillin acylase family protein [Pontibacillus sp. HN14]WIF99722.1 penicillin acylase family protein [Pontibacillus chungwhensis]
MEVVSEQKRKKSLKRWQKVCLILLVLLLGIGIGVLIFVNGYINRSLPQTEGSISVPGLKDTVYVTRDKSGVPHIEANNTQDLFMAQGYVQAQDRLFQMDMARRQASGRLSEVAGEDALNQDKYFRTLGLRRAAEKSYQAYTEEAKQVMEWYAEGVNAYIEQAKNEKALPIEFTLLGGAPELWTPIDSLTIGKYMAFDLGGHWERQAFHYYLLQHYPEDQALELFSTYPEKAPTIIKSDELDIASSFEGAVIPHAFNGSNNWVVSGERTASGSPLLADDPHLGLATPSIWLQMVLDSPEYQVSGVIFAGIPGIILGHNQDIAWGVTNTGPDVQQLYLEKRNPKDENEFLYEGKYEKATIYKETIDIKDKDSIQYKVVETRHGPIISEFAEESGKDTVLSLRWTALDSSTELEAILLMNKASNWGEFEKGLEKFLVPAQNFVFASKDGTIAYKANGKIPIYKEGEDALLPLEGWEKENDWNGFIPFDELPTVINPDKGFIATANNKVIGEEYPYHLSNNWAQPYRYKRIEEVLEKTKNATAEDMKKLQMDQMNLQAKEFVPMFMEYMNTDNLSTREKEAVERLQAWDFVDDAKQSQPLLFHTWMKTLTDRLYEDLPESMDPLFKGKGQTTDELLRKAHKGKNVKWVEEQGGMEVLVQETFQETVRSLTEQYGEKIDEWEWGHYHQVAFKHPLSSISFLDRFFNSEDPIPVGGSRVTVMAASYNEETGIVNHGASWRFVLDGSDFTKGSHIVGPGQSGHFRSPWYHDQREDWVKGDYHETSLTTPKGEPLILQP